MHAHVRATDVHARLHALCVRAGILRRRCARVHVHYARAHNASRERGCARAHRGRARTSEGVGGTHFGGLPGARAEPKDPLAEEMALLTEAPPSISNGLLLGDFPISWA